MPPLQDMRRLETLLGMPPNSFMQDKRTHEAIRSRLNAMIGPQPPLACLDAIAKYKTMLQRANNAVSGGGNPSTFATVWGNFIAAAIAVVECLNNQAKNPPA